ncbi:MAG TPA: VOC family protein [Chthoniobacterales bacterium]|nr:VOC family protein [Chthoniobacterales bacterium]
MGLKRRVGKSRLRYPRCYSVTVFTKRWKEIRNFYVNVLGGQVVSEREHRYCDLLFGSVPICFRAFGDGDGHFESHFHLYLALRDRRALLERLKASGVIVRIDGVYASFLDPEGRTIKVTEEIAVAE